MKCKKKSKRKHVPSASMADWLLAKICAYRWAAALSEVSSMRRLLYCSRSKTFSSMCSFPDRPLLRGEHIIFAMAFLTNCLWLRFMFDQVMPLSDALSGYDMFEKMKVQKVVFVP